LGLTCSIDEKNKKYISGFGLKISLQHKYIYRVDFFLSDHEVAAACASGQALACRISAAVAVSDNILLP
jgi:hypothetical protein